MSTFLITGSSRGIGAAIAKAAAKEGHNVIINYTKNKEIAEALSASLGERAVTIRADVSSESDVKAMFSEAERLFGGIDVLVNNAGVSSFGIFQDVTGEEWDRVFGINVKGAFLCTKEALPFMIRNKCGSVINISSMWGEVGSSCEVAYSASKAALIGMTKALAKEVGPSGIRVNCITPGVIMTDMNSVLTAETLEALKEETPLGRLGTPENIADCVMFLASEKASFITGQIIGANGGLVI